MDRNVLLLKEMIRYYARDPKRIQHFIKVHDFAGMIGKLEGLEDDEQNILEIAAIVHDIGIKVSEEKYGDCSGKHQELEGPVIARKMCIRDREDSHLHLATHSGILSSYQSTIPYNTASSR